MKSGPNPFLMLKLRDIMPTKRGHPEPWWKEVIVHAATQAAEVPQPNEKKGCGLINKSHDHHVCFQNQGILTTKGSRLSQGAVKCITYLCWASYARRLAANASLLYKVPSRKWIHKKSIRPVPR